MYQYVKYLINYQLGVRNLLVLAGLGTEDVDYKISTLYWLLGME